MALMAQQLADLRQARARAEKFSGEAMSEKMGALASITTDTSAVERGLGDHRDRATGCKTDMRRQCAEKQAATRRPRAAITEIGNDSGANIWRDWHSRSLSPFGVNEHLASAPVDVIQGKGRNFAGPQAELRQHHEDSIIPPPQSGRSVTTLEDRLNLRRGEIGRQARELP